MSYFERAAKDLKRAAQSIEDIAVALKTTPGRVETALRGEHVVRIVHRGFGDDIVYMLECMDDGGLIKFHRNDDGSICFDLLPPHDVVDSQVWATGVAKKMDSYGFNAVCAPRWPDE